MPALPIIHWNNQDFYLDLRLEEVRAVDPPHEIFPLDAVPDEALRGAVPITIFDLAEFILGFTPTTGDDFAKAGLPILAGCQVCGESLAAYNAYPTKTGYIRCHHCLHSDLAYVDPADARADLFPAPQS